MTDLPEPQRRQRYTLKMSETEGIRSATLRQGCMDDRPRLTGVIDILLGQDGKHLYESLLSARGLKVSRNATELRSRHSGILGAVSRSRLC